MHRNRLKQPKIELFNLKAKHDYIPIEARNTNKNKETLFYVNNYCGIAKSIIIYGG